jgi:hypothetical protein
MDTPQETPQHIDNIFKDWPFDPGAVSVRMVSGGNDREVIQMRIEMGVLQLETSGRPDGVINEGHETYLEYLRDLAEQSASEFVLDEDQCFECDREFVQFYHRRICWLALQQYEFAVLDADHSLALMDFCRDHSPDDEWTLSHEQYRPFVMYHQIQADALAHVETDTPEYSIEAINKGLKRLRAIFEENEAEEEFEDDELVQRLVELRETLRTQFDVGKTLQEQLAEAVAGEHYELAAKLRDELANRRPGK